MTLFYMRCDISRMERRPGSESHRRLRTVPLTALMRTPRSGRCLTEQFCRSISDCTLADHARNARRTPAGMPLLAWRADDDYSLPFPYNGYPREAASHLGRVFGPSGQPAVSTLGDWFDQVTPLSLPESTRPRTVKSGSRIYILDSVLGQRARDEAAVSAAPNTACKPPKLWRPPPACRPGSPIRRRISPTPGS